jgi:hypothetical protein
LSFSALTSSNAASLVDCDASASMGTFIDIAFPILVAVNALALFVRANRRKK